MWLCPSHFVSSAYRAVVSIFGDLRSLVPSPPSKNEAVANEMTYRDLLFIPGDCEDL